MKTKPRGGRNDFVGTIRGEHAMNGINRRIVWESLDKPEDNPRLRDWLIAGAAVVAFILGLALL